MIDSPIEKSVVKDPAEDDLRHTGAVPSMIVKKCAESAAAEALTLATKGMSEGQLVGLEVVVTIKLQPAGQAARVGQEFDVPIERISEDEVRTEKAKCIEILNGFPIVKLADGRKLISAPPRFGIGILNLKPGAQCWWIHAG